MWLQICDFWYNYIGDSMILMTGEQFIQDIKDELKTEIKGYMIKPCIAVIQIGESSTNMLSIQQQIKSCNETGVYLKHIQFSEDTKEIEVINKIVELNNDDYVNGIALALPLPEKYNQEKLINYIARNKDVNGLTDLNVGKLWNNKKTFIPCIPNAIIQLLDFYKVSIEGKNTLVVGNDSLLGKPITQLLLQKEATVTVCNEKSEDIKNYVRSADIIICCSNQNDVFDSKLIKDAAIVVVAKNINIEKELCNNKDLEIIKNKCSFFATLEDGIMSLAILLQLKNVVEAYRKMNIEK